MRFSLIHVLHYYLGADPFTARARTLVRSLLVKTSGLLIDNTALAERLLENPEI